MLGPPRRRNNCASVFIGSIASQKVSKRSKNDLLSASTDKFEVGRCHEKVNPSQTDLEVKYFYNAYEKSDHIFNGTLVRTGRPDRDRWGRHRFWRRAATSNLSSGAAIESFFDRLDTFWDSIGPRNTLAQLFRRPGGPNIEITGTRKNNYFSHLSNTSPSPSLRS